MAYNLLAWDDPRTNLVSNQFCTPVDFIAMRLQNVHTFIFILNYMKKLPLIRLKCIRHLGHRLFYIPSMAEHSPNLYCND